MSNRCGVCGELHMGPQGCPRRCDAMAPTPPTEEPRGRDDILTLAQHCKTYADGDVYLAATRVLHQFRTADPFAAYERVVAERDEARQTAVRVAMVPPMAVGDSFFRERLVAAEAERDRLRSDLNQATAVVEAARGLATDTFLALAMEKWYDPSLPERTRQFYGAKCAEIKAFDALVDAYRAAPTGGEKP